MPQGRNPFEVFGKTWKDSKIGSFFSGLGNMIRGSATGFTEPFRKGFGNLGQLLENGFEGLYNKYTGAGLTPAEREANEFTHNERIESQDWTAEREDTEMQRRMDDYRAAGINPMMAAAGGVSSSSSGGQSVSPSTGSLSDLFQMALLPAQMEVMQAQAKNLEASAGEKRTKSDLNEAKTKLTEQQIEEAIQNIAESRKRVEKIESDIIRNAALNALSYAEAHLADVNAEDLTALRAARMALYQAEALEARADACLAYANALYQNKLIEAGMPQAVVEKIIAEKGVADAQKRETIAKAIEQELQNGKRTGSFSATIDKILRENGIESGDVKDAIIGGLTNLFDSIHIL